MLIYEKIEELCKRKSITVGALEKQLGFGYGTIRKWENSYPNANNLKKVADYFQVSMDYFF